MRYDLLLFAHIAAVIVWIGSGFLVQVLATMADHRRDEVTFAALLRYVADLGPRLFMPASALVLVFGGLLIADGPWTLGQLWVVLGLAGFAATFLTGVLLIKPQSERLAELTGESGVLGPDGMHEARKLLALTRIDFVVLVAVVYDMAAKPSGDDTGELILLFGGIVVGVAIVLGRARRLAAPAAPAAA